MKAKSKRTRRPSAAHPPKGKFTEAAQSERAPKMVKLWGGGERPETEADREWEARRAKSEAAADPAKAFRAASDLEHILTRIEYACDALRLIGLSEGLEENEQRAILGLVNTLDDALAEAEEKRSEIWDRTWSYAWGKRRTLPVLKYASEGEQ